MIKFTSGGKNRRDISTPLGGIGTGFTGLSDNGGLEKLKIASRPDMHLWGNSFFAVKAENGGKLIDAKIAMGKNVPSSQDAQSSIYFSGCEASSFFPFTEIKFEDASFPANVTVTAFNPFIPLNDTDSSIPAAFFEFEVTNTSGHAIDYTVCCLLENLLPGFRNTAGCSDNGAAYIYMDSKYEPSPFLEGNMCIATDGKHISFCEYIDGASSSAEDFLKVFTCGHTFNDSDGEKSCKSGKSGALATHFSLEPGKTGKVRFLISWYCPYSCYGDEASFRRNYYAQYFESSTECASYCFKHWERLKADTLVFTKTLLESTLDDSVLQAVTDGLDLLKGTYCLRLDNGSFYGFDSKEWLLSPSLLHLFPMLSTSMITRLTKEAAEKTDSSDFDTLTCLSVIIGSCRSFKLGENIDELIEGWYYLSRLCDVCFEKLTQLTNGHLKNTDTHLQLLYLTASAAAKEIAFTVGDKKRGEAYSVLLERYSSLIDEKELTKLIMNEQSYYSAALMLENGRFDQASELIFSLADNSQSRSMASYLLLSAMSGFEYDAYKKHIAFRPLSDYCPLDLGDTFRCFFSVRSGYGYVEEGIDYIEVNMISGSLDIRSFGVPRTPRLVQYGGRNWRFTDTGLCATLDTNLEVTPDKKLTILIDIKPQK